MEDDPDHFVIYGNALPTLEEEEASAKKMKPIYVEDQVATDDQGRRRFHGAFTGGFSAGFFNTAGRKNIVNLQCNMYTVVDRKSCPREKLHVKTLSLRGPLPGQRPPGETHQKL